MKTLDTLVKDIYQLFLDGHSPSQENVDKLGEAVAKSVSRSLKRNLTDAPVGKNLRMSSIGKPDRQVWYETHQEIKGEELRAPTLIKFLFGDILEDLLLFLVREAGHTVEGEQEEVDIGGVKGHMDSVIDGVLTDVKSTSSRSFKKFEEGTLKDDDPFGYIAQISGYVQGSGREGQPGAFLAIDKQNGKICVHQVPTEDLIDVKERVSHLQELVSSEEEPPRCYEPVPDGKSGNMKLAIGCAYCPFKHYCWRDANEGKGLRTFNYSGTPRFLVHVENEPRVTERVSFSPVED